MKAIIVFYDTLNRRYLPCYNPECGTIAPNFERLARHSVQFDNSYVGSMPCIPARRELHTGRYNFLHREWGPLEPFDDSMPEILKKRNLYSPDLGSSSLLGGRRRDLSQPLFFLGDYPRPGRRSLERGEKRSSDPAGGKGASETAGNRYLRTVEV